MAKIGNIGNFSALQGHCIATVGMFDGVHLGHRHVVSRLHKEAACRGLEPLVVTFDRHPRIVLSKADNGFRLLSTADERAVLLNEAGADNVVVLQFTHEMAQLSACRFFNEILVAKLGIRTLLLGYDNMFGSKSNPDFDRLPYEAARNGVELIDDEALLLNGIEVSSTQIRKALASGNIEAANLMLGHRYSVSGSVAVGRQVGRTLGFPTANITVADSLKAMPADGVYAACAIVGGKRFPAMANLGHHPTFEEGNPTFEVHLLDFSGDLYGKTITVEFIARLRDIHRFDNPDGLRHQLESDRETVRMITSQPSLS